MSESVQEAASKIRLAIGKYSHSIPQRIQDEERIASIIQETCFTLRPMEDAPRDGTSILVKIGDASFLPKSQKRNAGKYISAEYSMTDSYWVTFPESIYTYPDEWLAGWLPLPPVMSKETNTDAPQENM